MKIKRIFIYLFIFIITFSFIKYDTVMADDSDILDLPEFPTIDSNYIVLMDADSGDILYQKNADSKTYPASTTKLLTALLTVENSSLSDKIVFSEAAVKSIEPGDANASISAGEELTVEQALYCLILRSANEVAYGLAEHVSGSESQFAALMNSKLEDLGCVNSHFTNASGLTNEFHYTTPYDMALIAQACFNNKSLMKIISYSGLYTIGPTNKSKFTRYYRHRYQMLSGGDYAYKYSLGGKTGYTDAAGNCLVSFAEKDGLRLICVVMKGKEKTRYTDTIALFDYFYNNYKKVSLDDYDTGITSGNIDILEITNNIGSEKSISIGFEPNAYLLVPNKVEYSDLTGIVTYSDNAAYMGKENGFACVSYYYGDIDVGNATIYVSSQDNNDSVTIKKDKIFYINIWYILIGLIIICGITVLIIFTSKRNRRRHHYGFKKLHF